MEQRLHMVTLGVADLDRSVGFYEGLGWSRGARAFDGVAFFPLGGLVLALYPRAALAEDAGIPAEGAGFGGITLAYNARARDEVDAVLARATAAGARLLKAARGVFWGGYCGYFADPDGYPWEVTWNPHFPLSEDGGIVLPE